jgi:hypothetical protein
VQRRANESAVEAQIRRATCADRILALFRRLHLRVHRLDWRVIIAHSRFPDATLLLRSHYQFQIRTFWIGLLSHRAAPSASRCRCAFAATRGGTGDALFAELQASQPQILAWLKRSLAQMPPKAYRWIAEMHEIADFVR